MSKINKIKLSGTTYELQDLSATSGKVDTSTYTAYTAATEAVLSGKQETLSAGTGIDITNNVISVTGGGGGSSYTAGTGIDITNNIISVTGMVATSEVTSAVTSGSTDVLTSGGAYAQFGGLKIQQITQSAYDALSPNYDASTLYVIVN